MTKNEKQNVLVVEAHVDCPVHTIRHPKLKTHQVQCAYRLSFSLPCHLEV
jgi:hypothetical protein